MAGQAHHCQLAVAAGCSLFCSIRSRRYVCSACVAKRICHVYIGEIGDIRGGAEAQMARYQTTPQRGRHITPPRNRLASTAELQTMHTREFDEAASSISDVLPVSEDDQALSITPRRSRAKASAELADKFVGKEGTILQDFEAKDSKKELSVGKGTTVTILSCNDVDWWYVSCEGNLGYVPRKFVSVHRGGEEHADGASAAYTVMSTCVVRTGFRTASESVGKLEPGAHIIALETRMSDQNIMRVRCSQGWLSVTSANGKALLSRAGDGKLDAARGQRLGTTWFVFWLWLRISTHHPKQFARCSRFHAQPCIVEDDPT